uniref:Uncharacterized protein n=1 Tax=uncultured organism TaxID=155900 RepID=M1Q1I6_9ZZZZ|nr:hypothetical protein FLSS-17_0015 [uncultured organism]
MSFSYNENFSTDKDKIRFILGDTYDQEEMFSDEEITSVISTTDTLKEALMTLLFSITVSPDRLSTVEMQSQGCVDINDWIESTQEFAQTWRFAFGE